MIDFPVNTPVAATLAEHLMQNGVSMEELESELGLDSATILDPSAARPASVLLRLAVWITSASADPTYFLNFRHQHPTAPRHFSTWMSDHCNNVEELLREHSQYSQLSSIAQMNACFWNGQQLCFQFQELSTPPQQRWLVEYLLGFLHQRLLKLTDGKVYPQAVELMYVAPDYADDYEQVFKCPVQFSSTRNTIIYSAEAAAIPLATPDPHLYATLKQQADEQLRQLDPRVVIFNTKAKILTALPQDEKQAVTELSSDSIAAQLHMDRATLARRLKKYGLSFQAILDHTRREMSELYQQQGRSIEEIAHLTGFSEASSFRRAQKRWGKSD
ncbi:AraC family transcriptional regulator [Pseudomaricurvus alkylphenolicus]|uniref:helix-turn-helix transcriptional regulator n=1 Tax=Pseudomaricurvus alkylphenolicus TaxID=1306991 RepID=UPI00141F7491|nr:AraC family transcriptional regulator ligand-binding domain-containing protein [Pseudomaricurvus alkylphenolicus]NIB44921.1 AraC family transcriptional regulator [Pseudomaricurvus alkylphenolicus]